MKNVSEGDTPLCPSDRCKPRIACSMKQKRWVRRLFRSDLIPVVAVLSILIGFIVASPFLLDALWGNVPIVFYGRIVDDSGNPVVGAEVSMHVLAQKRLHLPVPFASSQTGWAANATTGVNGRFVIHGGRG